VGREARLAVVVVLLVSACGGLADSAPSATPVPTDTAVARVSLAPRVAAPAAAEQAAVAPIVEPVATLLAAGDIASCSSPGTVATAELLDRLPGTIATLGDNAYDGTRKVFAGCYAPTWGRHLARTRPAPGNHDYVAGSASAYFEYFGVRAGEEPRGYYSYDLGAWHLLALNSNCWAVGGCAAGSEQERWLRDDLGRSGARCTLAYWHHPRFSSGEHGSDASVADLFRALYESGADVVLAGHDHHYERFAPQDPDGRADPAKGIRSFVVGTGGRSSYAVGPPLPGSESIGRGVFGVLELTLRADGYDWRFQAVAGATFTDTGSASCV
jgi:hypothetical protein